MKRNGAHLGDKGPLETPLSGPSISGKAPVSSNRSATVLASGTVVLVLVTISLCFGEMVIQAIHLFRNDYPSIESMEARTGLLTSVQTPGRRATAKDRNVLMEITLDEARHQIRRPPSPTGLPQAQESAVGKADTLRDRRFLHASHISL